MTAPTRFTVGQRLGRLTVTQVKRGCVEQVRCDCGTDIATWLEFSFLTPPDEVGEYHARWLQDAEAGRLRYNTDRYRIHGMPNNAADAMWRGLLVDAPGGPVLTELGAHMLAHWKESRPGDKAAPADPPPFTEDRAAWIRNHAWTSSMRKTHTEVPGFYTTCACQWGRSLHCGRGRHGKCAAGTPLRDYAALIVFDGGRPAYFPEPYAHATDASATGPKFTQLAQVWLADRVCRWVCSCSCHTTPTVPAPPAEAGPLEAVQLDIFAAPLGGQP